MAVGLSVLACRAYTYQGFSIDLVPFVLPFGKIVGSLLTFPFWQWWPLTGVTLTLGCRRLLRVSYLFPVSMLYIAKCVPKSIVIPIFIVENKARLFNRLVVFLRLVFEEKHPFKVLVADFLHLITKPRTAIRFDKESILREVLFEPLDKEFYGHISCFLVTLSILQVVCQTMRCSPRYPR